MRFNWHFYVLAVMVILGLLILQTRVGAPYAVYLVLLAAGIFLSTALSLLTSFYVYDLSGLYRLSWLNFIPADRPMFFVTIHAGFDETSALLQQKFPLAHLHVFDFYDPALHTEVSIRRARNAYPAYPGTQTIHTSVVPLANGTADYVFLLLAAHEIRQEAERVRFFTELRRVLKPAGQIVVVEHLRDSLNFLAYTIGFLHFMPQSAWTRIFTQAAFTVGRQQKLTPFITLFLLQKDGVTA